MELKKLINTTILLTALLLIIGCQKSYDSIDIIDVKPEFEFTVKEKFSSVVDDRIGFLEVRMNAEISCDRVNFDSDFSIHNNKIEYTLYSITKPEDCLNSTVIPVQLLPMISLEEKAYSLSLNISGAYEIKGQLINNPDFFYLSFPAQYDMPDFQEVIYKVPENIVWGRISFTDYTDLKPVNNFIEQLNEILPAPEMTIGKYTPFIITESEVNLNASEYPAQSQFSRSFIASAKDREERILLEGLIDNFVQETTSSNGNRYLEVYSWTDEKLSD